MSVLDIETPGLDLVMDYRATATELDGLPNLLVQGDSTKRHTLNKGVADLIVTSPPYNLGKEYNGTVAGDELGYKDYMQFSQKWLENCYFWSRTTGRLCVNVSLDKNKNGKQPLSADITAMAMRVGWKYHATVIWNENNISRRTAWGSWKSASAPHIIAPVETVLVFYKDHWKRERQGVSDISKEEFMDWVLGVWSFNGESAKRVGHKAPFPRELPKRCIKLLSFPGDVVLDPFMGSGTTMIEAITLGRGSIGIELEKHYCKLIRERIDKQCGLKLAKASQTKLAQSTLNCWTG